MTHDENKEVQIACATAQSDVVVKLIDNLLNMISLELSALIFLDIRIHSTLRLILKQQHQRL